MTTLGKGHAGALLVLLTLIGAGALGQSARANQDVKFNIYAPYSTDLKAGKGGILVNAGNCPDDAQAVPGAGSKSLEITQDGFSFSFRRPPVRVSLTMTDRGMNPAAYVVPRGTEPRLTTFSITNRGTREHRFGGRFITPKTVMIIDGKDFTIPPPTSGGAYIIITEGSTFNIGGEVRYQGSYVGVKPGHTVDVTLDLDQYVSIPELKSKELRARCDLPGHQDTFLIALEDSPTSLAERGEAEAFPARRSAPSATRENTDHSATQRYRWRPSRARASGLASEGLLVRGELVDGRHTNSVTKAPGGSGRLGFDIGPGSDGLDPVIDAPGSTNIHIEVDPSVGSTTYAGLTFTAACVVDLLRDGTVTARLAGVSASDGSGNRWVSRRIRFNGRFVNAFLPR